MKNERWKLFLKRNAECVVAYCVLLVVLVLFAANQADFFTVYGPQSIFNQVITNSLLNDLVADRKNDETG